MVDCIAWPAEDSRSPPPRQSNFPAFFGFAQIIRPTGASLPSFAVSFGLSSSSKDRNADPSADSSIDGPFGEPAEGDRPEAEQVQEGRIDPAVVAALYAAHGEELRRFLVGLLRDRQLAGDVLQSTFVRALEAGHATREESRKGWLFRVAYHEAMAVRRRESTGERVVRDWSREQAEAGRGEAGQASDEPLLRREAIDRVQQVLATLPPEQREVVRLRIYEEMTFAQIAEQLGIPLGTALGRMRAAAQKLKIALSPPEY